MWKHEEFEDERRYQHNDGTILQYRVNFENFGVVIPKYGKDMNELIEAKEVTKLPPPQAVNEFSYNGVCRKTLGDDTDGQINYPMGHEGIAVASRTGYGDGFYPVVAELNSEGRVKSLTITFIDDDDE
jgi:hypothetical protein